MGNPGEWILGSFQTQNLRRSRVVNEPSASKGRLMGRTNRCGTMCLGLFCNSGQQRDIWSGAGLGFGTSDGEFYTDFPCTRCR